MNVTATTGDVTADGDVNLAARCSTSFTCECRPSGAQASQYCGRQRSVRPKHMSTVTLLSGVPVTQCMSAGQPVLAAALQAR
jgi:hypothetical protein